MNKNVLNLFLCLVAVLSLSSCDCMQKADGVILDQQTKQPIKEVSVSQNEAPKENAYVERSDESGHYIISAISGGLCGCPDIVLNFSKDGYKTRKITFSSRSSRDTVYLERRR